MRPPHPHPFLHAEAREAHPDAHAFVFGMPSASGVSFRGGAEDGPEGIRRFSESLETYSPRARRDLADLRTVDLGDCPNAPGEADQVVGEILEQMWAASRPLVGALGGDHSITPPVAAAVAARTEHATVVGFDAHLDLRSSYPGEHACTFHRLADRGIPCVLLGPRSGTREEWDAASRLLLHHSTDLVLPPQVRRRLASGDVYVTVDIDVLDPSAAPGTGNPEPGGPGFDELLEALEALEGLRVVGFDVVEVAPSLDPSGITQAAAAKVVREMLLRFAGR